MSDSYTKLTRSIAASTICTAPLAHRWLWVIMLSQCNAKGEVFGSIPGLARIANIEISECESALESFLSPDKYSRTKDHEGRRICEIDGGWVLLNHEKYSRIRDTDERREYMADFMRKKRAKEAEAATSVSNLLADVSNVSTPLAGVSNVSCVSPTSTSTSTSIITSIKKSNTKKREPKSEITFSQWVEKNPSAEFKSACEYCDSIGVPQELSTVAFFEFEQKYTTTDASKKYKCWELVLLKAIKENWLKVWYKNQSGEYQLTTRGQQAQASMLASAVQS